MRAIGCVILASIDGESGAGLGLDLGALGVADVVASGEVRPELNLVPRPRLGGAEEGAEPWALQLSLSRAASEFTFALSGVGRAFRGGRFPLSPLGRG